MGGAIYGGKNTLPYYITILTTLTLRKNKNPTVVSYSREQIFRTCRTLSLVSSFLGEETNCSVRKIHMPVLLCTHFSLAIIRWKLTLNFLPFHLGKVLGNFQDYFAITSQHASNFLMTHLMRINHVYFATSLNCLISPKEVADWLSFFIFKKRRGKSVKKKIKPI